MKRQKLRTSLADAISATMSGHTLTVPNVKRYCNRDVRSSFSIRRDTTIKLEDWIAAIELSKPKPVKNVKKVNCTPTQPVVKPDWRERRLRSLERFRPSDPLEYQARKDLILLASSESVYTTRFAAWLQGLQDTVSTNE